MSLHPNTYRLSPAGLAFLKLREGFRAHWYLDTAGKPTIGYGHLIRSAKEQKELVEITQEHAEVLLISDVRIAEIYINNSCRVVLSQNQFDALVSFAFNLGCGALESSHLYALVNTGQFDLAAQEFARWCHEKYPVTGLFRVNKGLKSRRLLERDLFLKAIN